MIEQAVILAGGKGTRLGPEATTRPKALIELSGQPLIAHQFAALRRHGVRRVLVLTGHLGDVLAEEIGDGSRFELEVSCAREETPLGTAGALKAAESLLDEDFFVVYGDIIFDIELGRLGAAHLAQRPAATLVVHPNDHPHDSDLVETNSDGRIVAFHPKTRDPATLAPNLVNAGLYVLSRRCTDFVPSGAQADFGLDTFPAMLAAGETLLAYNTPEYAKDAGTPERRKAVSADISSGKVARRNIANPQTAVFLDRDGVISEEHGEARTAGTIALLPGVAGALRALNASDLLSVVVTNQAGIAKGQVSEADVAAAHAKLDTLLGADGAYVHAWYVCPHHPETGFPGERQELKIVCDCRKPAPGMLLSAAERFNIDLSRSFMVGDRTIDVEAGRRAGVCTIGVRTGYGVSDAILPVRPDFLCDDLADAVGFVGECEGFILPAIRAASEAVSRKARLVAVGGLSRAGKSVFAGLLSWQLRRAGGDAKILRLDDFLKPEDERARLQKVADRFDEAEIAAAIEDRLSQPGVTVVEGVPALLYAAIRKTSGLNIFVRLAEAVRFERFRAQYAARGRTPAEIRALYEGRDAEERATIEPTAGIADLVVEGGVS